jgi:uncharacterized repeat protein (TIGR04138 family)
MQDELLLTVEALAEHEGRYHRDAYLFIFAALNHTVQELHRDQLEDEAGHHVSGQELAHGIAEYAREQFGPMVQSVFNHWGIHETLDFGRIVFSLIDAGLMRKTENDRLEDFQDVYRFDEIFDPKRIQDSLDRMDLEQL